RRGVGRERLRERLGGRHHAGLLERLPHDDARRALGDGDLDGAVPRPRIVLDATLCLTVAEVVEERCGELRDHEARADEEGERHHDGDDAAPPSLPTPAVTLPPVAAPAGSGLLLRPDHRVDEVVHYGPSCRAPGGDRKSTRLNSSHVKISYAVFCLKK